jgi:hypothetical protein
MSNARQTRSVGNTLFCSFLDCVIEVVPYSRIKVLFAPPFVCGASNLRALSNLTQLLNIPVLEADIV